MQFLAIWDNLFLLHAAVIDLTVMVYGQSLETLSTGMCKLVSYNMWVVLVNASAHLVALAIDRAVFVVKTTWHNSVSWLKINKYISICISAFHALVFAPMAVLYEATEDGCVAVSKFPILSKVYQASHFTLSSFSPKITFD